MKRLSLFSFIVIAAMLLGACMPAAGTTGPGVLPDETQSPIQTPTGEPTQAPTEELSPIVQGAIAYLAEVLGLEPATLTFVSIEEAEFSDSCLGGGGPAELCAAVMTPGHVIKFTSGDTEYTVHADEAGTYYRIPYGAPGYGATPPAPRVVDEGSLAAIRELARRLGISMADIVFVSSEPAEWGGGCLGVPAPDEVCTMQIVNGFRVVLDAQGRLWEFRTSQDGSIVRLSIDYTAEEGVMPVFRLEDGDPAQECKAYAFAPANLAEGPCRSEWTGASVMPVERGIELAYYRHMFQPFELSLENGGTFYYDGDGSAEATEAQKQAMLAWARQALAEVKQVGEAPAPALEWQREGGIAGFCDVLTVEASGQVIVSTCKGNETRELYRGIVTADEMAKLAELMKVQAFEYFEGGNIAADEMNITTRAGVEGAPEIAESDDQKAAQALAQEIFDRFVVIATTQPSDTGTKGPGGDMPALNSDEAVARDTVLAFFDRLNGGNFGLASELFGGDEGVLASLAPAAPANDLGALFEAGCTTGKLRCDLKVADARLVASPEADTWTFGVSFDNPDGTPFEMEGISEYTMTVKKVGEADFRVMDLPPVVK